jgi:sulfatase maturation enzyme AslB (radical SAM superfamily)
MWKDIRAYKRGMVRHLKALLAMDLPCLEVHLVDHCNLNCSGCGHYSQMASPTYTDLGRYETDIKRLGQLFRNITMIRLMGGEPLLHPDPASFVTVARSYFPRTDLWLVTNGTLLPKASAAFWEACRNTKTAIDLTIYPPFKQRAAEWQSLCDTEMVTCRTHEVHTFHKHMNLRGDSNKGRAFLRCRNQFYSPFLQDGRLYTCPKPALVHYFNSKFGTEIAADSGINIHSSNTSAREILDYIDKPIETCKWCTYGFTHCPWSSGKDSVHSWYLSEEIAK